MILLIPKYMCACTNFTSDYYKLLRFVVCKKVPTPYYYGYNYMCIVS